MPYVTQPAASGVKRARWREEGEPTEGQSQMSISCSCIGHVAAAPYWRGGFGSSALHGYYVSCHVTVHSVAANIRIYIRMPQAWPTACVRCQPHVQMHDHNCMHACTSLDRGSRSAVCTPVDQDGIRTSQIGARARPNMWHAGKRGHRSIMDGRLRMTTSRLKQTGRAPSASQQTRSVHGPTGRSPRLRHCRAGHR